MSGIFDRALVKYMNDKAIIANFGKPDRMKIALIGEHDKTKRRESLAYQIHKEFHINLNKITVFTERNFFRPEDGRSYDLLIGMRPCGADEMILEAAERYKKQFVLVPCTCGGYSNRVLHLIRNYPIIECVDSRAEMFVNTKTGEETYNFIGWIILYNKRIAS